MHQEYCLYFVPYFIITLRDHLFFFAFVVLIRFIRWDVDPLNEAKQQLDEIVASQQARTGKINTNSGYVYFYPFFFIYTTPLLCIAMIVVSRADRAKNRAFSVGLQRGVDDYLQMVR